MTLSSTRASLETMNLTTLLEVRVNNKTGLVTGLIEKPNFENAPSNLASINRYVLTPDIFDILRNQSIGYWGEIQFTDSINMQAENNMVDTILSNGKRFDYDNIKNGTNNLFVKLISFK